MAVCYTCHVLSHSDQSTEAVYYTLSFARTSIGTQQSGLCIPIEALAASFHVPVRFFDVCSHQETHALGTSQHCVYH